MRIVYGTALLSLLAPGASWSQGHVHVVDRTNGPGTDFTDLAAAVSSAADGDVLLVRAGFYDDALELADGRGLTVVADVGAPVEVIQIGFRNIPSNRFALLQGLVQQFNTPALDCSQDQGPVWFEGCSFETMAGQGAGLSSLSLCDAVIMSRCLVRGPAASPFGTMGALNVNGTNLFLYDSQVEALAPSATLSLSGSILALSGSSVLGGDGANGTPFSCDGQDGGMALLVINSSQVSVLDSVLEGGTGGMPLGACDPGADGEDLVTLGGSASFVAAEARSLEMVSPVREDELLQATFTGKPGDRVWIVYSMVPGSGLASARWDGRLVLGSPRAGFFVGTIDGSGSLVFQTAAPDLPSGVESAIFFLQGLFRDTGTRRFVTSAPSAMVLLDSAF